MQPPMKIRLPWFRLPRTRFAPERAARGQSLVEFALVLPLLMILLLGVADFGRVFQSAIASEAAVRDAAEAAAQNYLQLDLQDGNFNGSLTQADYNALHALALEVGCREAERLPGRTLSGSTCTMPVFAVCIHDNAQGDATTCGSEASSAPAECTHMSNAWSAVRSGPTDGRAYVEVRMCYRFDPLMTLALGNWGSVWLQKENDFAVTNYAAN